MEIELKARMRDRDAVVARLETIGCAFSTEKVQDDTVWVQRPGPIDTYLSNPVFLRVRIQDSKALVLTAKRPAARSGDASLAKREHEVTVNSADEVRGILELLGLHSAVRTVKRRRTAKHGNFEICLDDVEGLGTFIELEQFGEREEAQKIQDSMRTFLGSLGIAEEDIVSKGYDVLMLEGEK